MAAVVHPSAADSLFNRSMDVSPNVDFASSDFSLSIPFDQARRSTNTDGLPTPAPTQRNSHGSPSGPVASSSSRSPFANSVPLLAADPGSDAPSPSSSLSRIRSPQPQGGSPRRYSESRRTSRSPPPANPDTMRQMTESPTSFANGNVNEYSEGFRLFPPSPASSAPKPQTPETQQEIDPEPEPAPEDDGRPSWDKRQWFQDQRAEQPDTGALPRRKQQLEQQQQVHDPAISRRARGDAQWAEPWRSRDEQTWPEPAPRARAEVRVSGSARAQAQQPTVVAASPPVQQQQAQPQEEVCIECAMRDQDMADVDVTGPGVWGRESDVAFEELLQREIAEEEAGIVSDDSKRPRARGGRLTEANLRLWLTLNPKEPTSKRAVLDAYVRSQYALLEAETAARARAMHESRMLDDRMRDTYSALRRSTQDLLNVDGGVRLETSAHGRDVTLLENGLVVEHVDVRREERARRREEKRLRGRSRKSSRGSVADVASVYSLGSPLMYAADAGLSSPRPMSVLTAPIMGESMSAAHSVIALGNAAPHSRSTMSIESPNRRTKFFGMRNLSQGFRSSDSLAGQSGFSGSMIDMHVALQREKAAGNPAARQSALWHEYQVPQLLEPQRAAETQASEKPKKKKKGLAKLWGIVTGTTKSHAAQSTSANPQTRSLDREEDYPLAPPPPMSYLASRGTSRDGNQRHVSTPSLPTVGYGSTSTGVSPPSAPSSILPSPTSSRPFTGPETIHIRKGSGAHTYESEHMIGSVYAFQPPAVLKPVGEESPAPTPRGVSLSHMISEPDMRQRLSIVDAPPVPRIPATIGSRVPSWRDKTLPPLPGEMGIGGEGRPRTLFGMYDSPEPPVASFRQEAGRRQSFSGAVRPVIYGEMNSRQSSLMPPTTPTQSRRKSKFGFGALLGRSRRESTTHEDALTVQQFRTSDSEARHEALVSAGMGVARGPTVSPQPPSLSRMSISLASKKNIEALVDQAPDFVAYRYPSTGGQ